MTEHDDDLRAGKNASRTELRGRLYRIAIYALVLIALTLLIWKVIHDSVVQMEHQEALRDMRNAAEEQFAQRSQELALAVGIAAEVAAAGALSSGNIQQLRTLADRLVAKTAAAVVMVTDADGRIAASSERGREGNAVDPGVRNILGSLGEATVDDVGEGRIRVVVPLMDARLPSGYLIIIFETPALQLASQEE